MRCLSSSSIAFNQRMKIDNGTDAAKMFILLDSQSDKQGEQRLAGKNNDSKKENKADMDA